MKDQGASTSTVSIFVIIYSLLAGVLLASIVELSPLLGVFFLLLGGTVFVGEKVLSKSVAPVVWLVVLALLSFGLGVLRYEVKDFHIDKLPESTGVVVSEPERRDNSTRFVLEAEGGERALVYTDLYSQVAYGDRVEVAGEFERPGVIVDEVSGREFDYAKYLSKDDIYYTMSFAKVEVFSSGHGNALKHTLFGLKHSLVGKMKALFAEPESSLLAGLIVSGKDAMPESILEEFRRAGIVHIVVLSGFNITIIADFLRKFFETLFLHLRARLKLPQASGPKLAAGASILGIVAFIIMTGAQATVVRAGIMVLVVIASKMFGRQYSAPRALLSAGFVMVLHNPKIMVFDASFQLSFLATLALIYVSPLVEPYLKRIPEGWWGLRTALATTIATQVVVLPYLVYSMGDVSLVSLLANILVLPMISLTMLVGFMATMLGFVSGVLAAPLSYATHLCLSWILGVSSVLGNLKYTSLAVPAFPFWITILMYLALFILVMRWRKEPHVQPIT